MSNLERRPQEIVCAAGLGRSGPVDVLEPRDVPLGGLRAMRVRRTLPQRERSLIGAWCFLDHYGPEPVSRSGGMVVAPHPHTGLQTVSWLFSGEIEHRDSAGHHAMVRPGELTLMTAGRGISHSEVSTPATTVLHGVQLWVALPDGARAVAPRLDHHVPDVVELPGARAQVFLGTLAGVTSPVRTHTPLLGAEVVAEAGAAVALEVDPSFEHGVLVDSGRVTVEGTPVEPGHLAYLPAGHRTIRLAVGEDGPARVVLLGGEPFGESIVMWWNFVGRSHEEVVAARALWQAQLPSAGTPGSPGSPGSPGTAGGPAVLPGHFGVVAGNVLAPIPAPELPGVRLRPRAAAGADRPPARPGS